MYIRNRFWKHIKRGKRGECWPWIGKLTDGYGAIDTIFLGGHIYQAHRVAFILYKGKVPKGKFVLHKCNNRKCCNPWHLYAGTKKDNKRDSMKAGTFALPRIKGEQHWRHKLTERQVKAILRAKQIPGLCRKLSQKYKVGDGIISMIRNRKIWKHVNF